MRKTVLAALAAGIALLPFGCGYTQKATLPQGIESIYVETVKNKIPLEQLYAYKPGLEIEITNAVIRRLHRDGNLSVVPREEADAVLEAELTGFQQEGMRFNSLEAVEEFRMFMVLSMRLKDKNGRVLWEESNFTGDAEYFVNTVRSIPREEAAQRAVDRLARNIVDRIVEDW